MFRAFLISLLVELLCLCTPYVGFGAGEWEAAPGVVPLQYDAAQADNILRRINRTRPAITMFLYPGHPAHYAQHRVGRSDAERILGYFDPVIGMDWGGYWPDAGCKGAPDLERTIQSLGDRMPWLDSLNAYGMLHTQGLVTCGHPPYPDPWLPEGASRDEYDDRPVGSSEPGRLALANPRLYTDVVYPTIEKYLGGVEDMSRAALLWCESEPGAWNDYETFRTTGNPHTIALFQGYMRDLYRGDIGLLNRAAGTEYESFADIRPSDDKWLIRIKVAHFGSYLLYAFYQGRTVNKYRETFPQIPVATRWCELVGGVATDPRDCSRFDTVQADYLGLTWYSGNPFVPYSDNRCLMGKVTSNGSFLSNYRRPIAWGETAMWRADERGPYIRPFQPCEVTNLIYRSLYYNLGLLMMFNWSFPSGNPTTWISHADSQETLRAVQATINELDRIKPYATFGQRHPPPVGIVITREAAGFPVVADINSNTHYYNDVVHGAAAVMEDPRASHIDLMEEHCGLSLAKLSRYHGLIVYDACLSAATRGHVQALAESGRKLLVIGPYRYLDDLYLPAPLPASYPVQKIGGREGEVLAKTSRHPLFAEIPVLKLKGAAVIAPRPGAQACLTADDGRILGAVSGNVVYLSGVPTDIDQRRELYVNFIRWCGGEPVDLYLSRWQDALIAHNFKSAHTDIRVDGRVDGYAFPSEPLLYSITVAPERGSTVPEERLLIHAIAGTSLKRPESTQSS